MFLRHSLPCATPNGRITLDRETLRCCQLPFCRGPGQPGASGASPGPRLRCNWERTVPADCKGILCRGPNQIKAGAQATKATENSANPIMPRLP